MLFMLNQIYNWTPRVFNETDENQISDENERSQYRKMPDFLKEAIAQTRDPKEVCTIRKFYKFLSISLFA